MSDRKLYVLAQFDQRSQTKLYEIQKILIKSGIIGKQTSGIPYHLSLGMFDPNKESELKERLRTIAGKTSSLTVTLSHIGLFGLNVLFLAPNVTHELIDLQSHFIKDSCSPYEWTAHATLLLDEADIVQRALHLVADQFRPFYVNIDSLSLYEFSPTRFIDCKKLNEGAGRA